MLGNDIFQFDYSGPILTPVLNYDKFYPPYPPPLSRPWGTSLHWDLKKKADSSSTQPPLSESAKKWVPKIPTEGPLNKES